MQQTWPCTFGCVDSMSLAVSAVRTQFRKNGHEKCMYNLHWRAAQRSVGRHWLAANFTAHWICIPFTTHRICSSKTHNAAVVVCQVSTLNPLECDSDRRQSRKNSLLTRQPAVKWPHREFLRSLFGPKSYERRILRKRDCLSYFGRSHASS